jgi:tripartite-type tricarboxylate transporter receptor subunit TctC
MAAAQWPLRAVAQGATQAPPYPTRPIRFVMPYAPGGSSEILARPIAVELSKSLGQQVIVDFKPGGGTTIGADFVAKSPPDGYNIVMMLSAHAINATLMPRLPYDPVKDFAVVTMAATLPLVVVVPASVADQDLSGIAGGCPRAARQAHLRIRGAGRYRSPLGGVSSSRCSRST